MLLRSGGSLSGGATGGVPELPKSIRAFDGYCTEFLDPFVAACAKLEGDAAIVGGLVKAAWGELRKFLIMATVCKEPEPAKINETLKGLMEPIKAIQKAVNRNAWEKHTKTVSEGVGILNWVVIKPAPRDYMESFIGGSDYWANGIRKEYKATNPDHIAFCDTFKKLLLELMPYVKEYHTTGTTWNKNGIPVSEYNPDAAPAAGAGGAGGGAAAAAAVTAAPKTAASVSAAAAAAANPPKVNLFAALNKGGDITSGLKTVTKDMQTWRADYKPDESKPAPVAKKAVAPRAVETVKGPPKKDFDAAAAKWTVECQSASDGVVEITIGDKKEMVYIYGCIGATIKINGKCKSIAVDGCKKTSVTFGEIMASCEIVNCSRMKIYCLEKASAIAIDKTDGIEIYLPKDSLSLTEILASKSSEMNVSFPDESGELVERPIPEQYVHRIRGGKVTADVSDLYSH